MRIAEVEIGGRYTAKVSGRLVTVVVTGHADTRGIARFEATNEATGRKLAPLTAARLRGPVQVFCASCGRSWSGCKAQPCGSPFIVLRRTDR